MRMSDFLALCGYSRGDINAVMPLTNTLKPEKPEDVIGFAWQSLDDEQPKILTLPGREWESTAEYTGLDAELYRGSQVEHYDLDKDFQDMIGLPIVAFSKGVAIKAFGALHFSPVIIGLPEALAKTVSKLKPPEELTIRAVASWLNSGRPLLRLSRYDSVKMLKLDIERRDGMPVTGFNLAADLGMLEKLLDREVLDPSEEQDSE